MRSAVTHFGLSVVVALLVVAGVSCMPASKNAHLASEDAAHHIQRRAPVEMPAVQNNTTACNKSDDNSTACSTDSGLAQKVKAYFLSNPEVIYRALVVLGSVSLIVLVYISFRYFR